MASAEERERGERGEREERERKGENEFICKFGGCSM